MGVLHSPSHKGYGDGCFITEWEKSTEYDVWSTPCRNNNLNVLYIPHNTVLSTSTVYGVLSTALPPQMPLSSINQMMTKVAGPGLRCGL